MGASRPWVQAGHGCSTAGHQCHLGDYGDQGPGHLLHWLQHQLYACTHRQAGSFGHHGIQAQGWAGLALQLGMCNAWWQCMRLQLWCQVSGVVLGVTIVCMHTLPLVLSGAHR
jgi:hypothetical protein